MSTLVFHENMLAVWELYFSYQDTELDDFRVQLIKALDKFESLSHDTAIPSYHIFMGKYIMSAFFDELILQSELGLASNWVSNPLQLELFQESSAGEKIFQHLAKLRLEGFENLAILELFYICLSLGYEGHYRYGDKTQLIKLRIDLLKQIESLKSLVPNSLKKHETATLPKYFPKQFQKIAYIAAGFIVFISCTLWSISLVKASHITKQILREQIFTKR